MSDGMEPFNLPQKRRQLQGSIIEEVETTHRQTSVTLALALLEVVDEPPIKSFAYCIQISQIQSMQTFGSYCIGEKRFGTEPMLGHIVCLELKGKYKG